MLLFKASRYAPARSPMKINGKPDRPDRLEQRSYFQENVTLNAGILSLSFSAITIAAYACLTNQEYKDTLYFAVTTLAISAGVISAFYVGDSIKNSVRSQELDRTLSYITRWNDPRYLPIRKTAQELYQVINNQPISQQEKRLREYLEEHPDKKQDISNVLNFLEEMSLCIEKGLLQEDFLYDFYRYILITYCEKFEVFIKQQRRERQNDKLYKGMTDLCEKWRKRSESDRL